MPCLYSGKQQLLRMKILRPNKRCDAGFIGYGVRISLTYITFDGAEVSAKDYGMIGVAVGDCIVRVF